jgi:hypothetical protein
MLDEEGSMRLVCLCPTGLASLGVGQFGRSRGLWRAKIANRLA